MVFQNKLSWFMLLLSLLVLLLAMFSKMNFFHSSFHIFLVHYLIMITLIVFFVCFNYLVFFVCFEFVLPLIMMIIGVWGYQPERLQASMYLFMYTVMFSLPFLILLLSFFATSMVTSMLTFKMISFPVLSVAILLAPFLVKCPVYFLHFWLPKAHVEAPSMGSIILAGVLLKLGGFGMLFMLFHFFNFSMQLFVFFMLLVGAILSVLVCCTQTDQKAMVAYASVNHMTIMVMAMMSKLVFSLKVCLMLMFIHGFVSSAMFYFSNLFYYMFNTRVLTVNHGVVKTNSFLFILMAMVLFLNFAVPISLPFISELLILYSVYIMNDLFLFMLFLMVIISCYYSLIMLIKIFHGKFTLSLSQLVHSSQNMNIMLWFVFLSVFMISTLNAFF